MRETTTLRNRVRLRPVWPSGWWFDGLLVAVLVAMTLALANGLLVNTDLAVRDWVNGHRPDIANVVALVLNYLGQGGPLTLISIGLAVLVGWRTRSVRPLFVPATAFVFTYLTIGPAKVWTDRAAPSSKLPPEESVQIFATLPPAEYDMSYPSGHVANTVVWYGVIALLLAALLRTLGRPDISPTLYRAMRILPPVIVFCTTTYLGHHWLTDSVAGLLLGLFLDRLLSRVPWDDVPLPALPMALNRPGVFTSTP